MTKGKRLDDRFILAYRADYSARYHRRRASFLLKLDKFSNLLAIVAGTSVFVSLMEDGPVIFAQLSALTVSVLAIGQVVLEFGTLGSRHAEWMRGWDKLANDIRAKPNPTDSDIEGWDKARAEIEGDCISELRALGYDCENQTKSHLGIAEGHVKINRLQRALIQIGTFQDSFPEIRAASAPCHPVNTSND